MGATSERLASANAIAHVMRGCTDLLVGHYIRLPNPISNGDSELVFEQVLKTGANSTGVQRLRLRIMLGERLVANNPKNEQIEKKGNCMRRLQLCLTSMLPSCAIGLTD